MAARTVLIVEDDPAIRAGIVDALKVHGYATGESGGGAGAAELALGAGARGVEPQQRYVASQGAGGSVQKGA